MKAAFLVKYGRSDTAFEIREQPPPKPAIGEILIRVDAFGLNFADVMARLGHYKDAPLLPAVLGYDVVGHIEELGAEVNGLNVGDRVIALTRFGGYAEYALAQQEVCCKIPDSFSYGQAVALATQYCTAYFLAYDLANIREGETVLVHAAAGGVGTALVQLALYRNCTVFGTCGSINKMTYLEECGVHYPINYREADFKETIVKTVGERKVDVVFDPVGGPSVKKGYRLLAPGGRLLSFGVSSLNQTKSIFGKLRLLAQFGIYHPVQFLSQSRGMIGLNMLRVAEHNPSKIGHAMRQVIKLAEAGVLSPHVGGEFGIDELHKAHAFLESKKSMGKIVVKW